VVRCEHWDVVPDIITVAKGINSGYVPARRDGINEKLADWVQDKYFAGGLTYSGHVLACAAAIASIEAFQEEGIVENSPRWASARGGAAAAREKHPSIGEVRGKGSSGASSSSRPRDARAARPVQRAAGGVRAGGGDGEGGDGARPLPDDALERDHGLPAADDHARGARRGTRRSSTRFYRSRAEVPCPLRSRGRFIRTIRIEAPTTAAASHSSSAISFRSRRTDLVPLAGERWEVRVEDSSEDELDAVLQAVARWVADCQLSETHVLVDGEPVDLPD
jgi:hypothetical protein